MLVGRELSFVIIVSPLFFFVAFIVFAYFKLLDGCKSFLLWVPETKTLVQGTTTTTLRHHPGARVVPQCYRVMLSNINVLHDNRDELAIASTEFDALACAETKVLVAGMCQCYFCPVLKLQLCI